MTDQEVGKAACVIITRYNDSLAAPPERAANARVATTNIIRGRED
mgnify:FL=1